MTTVQRGQRGPYARTAQRRSEIGGAALEAVLEAGHENLTTVEVAKRAGVSEATVLYHFPTRDHLLIAALEQRDVLDANANGSTYRQPGETWNLEDFAQFARLAVREIRTLRLHVALSGLVAVPDHPAGEYFSRHYREAVSWFQLAVERWQSDGLADPRLDAREAARQILAVWDGLKLQWLAGEEFDIGDALVGAVRRLTGRDEVELQRAVMTALGGAPRSDSAS